jgi:hypothetical protein
MWLRRLSLRRNLVVEADSRDFNRAAFAMNDPMLPLPGLSSNSGKPVVVSGLGTERLNADLLSTFEEK